MTFRHENAAATTTPTNATPAGTRRRRARLALVGGAVAALPVAGLVTATSASAAPASAWDTVAQCESGGNWNISSGNGYSGGLQFTSSTWKAYGGTAYAPQAHQASRAQQISVAEKVLASQGPGAWPVCSRKAGLGKGGAPAAVDTSAGSSARNGSTGSSNRSAAQGPAGAKVPKSKAPQQAKPAQGQTNTSGGSGSAQSGKAQAGKAQGAAKPAKPAQGQTNTSGGGYTVRSGDTLSGIAARFGTDTASLYAKNVRAIGGNPDLIYPGQTLSI
ncbi:transglycosylase family protein [Kitasatospora sp. NPDC088351]|uniref:transglycosylase family protein n=1 Tax=Kitasatospora sp. NPDC088351 TaxID=3155180 RepID=UPI00342011F7